MNRRATAGLTRLGLDGFSG